jgi:hypothetical protein
VNFEVTDRTIITYSGFIKYFRKMEIQGNVYKPFLHNKKVCNSNRRIISGILTKYIIPIKIFRLHGNPDKQLLSYSERYKIKRSITNFAIKFALEYTIKMSKESRGH